MKPVKPKLANLIAAVDRQIDGMTTYMYNLCDVFITYVQCMHTYVPVDISSICNFAGRSLLHFSWLGIVWKRVFAHDAKNIVKWGVRTCLSMELKPESPILQKENWNVSENEFTDS